MLRGDKPVQWITVFERIRTDCHSSAFVGRFSGNRMVDLDSSGPRGLISPYVNLFRA